jgi:endoglucanase
MVNTRDYSWTTAEKDKDQRLLYAVTSVSTADFAAAMALASRVFKSVPGLIDRSARYLEAAEQAWRFLERHPGLYPDGGFIRPTDTKTGGYADSPDMNDEDDRLWAAVELAITTGQSGFIDSLRKRNSSFLSKVFFNSTSFDHELQWQDTYAFPFTQAALHDVPGLIDRERQRIRQQYLEHCDRLLQRTQLDGFGVALDRYYWGSSGGALAQGQLLVLGQVIDESRTDYINAAIHQLHFVLGRNALNTSFVSGFGSRYPHAIHHATFENDGIDAIFPGLIAGGPNPGLSGDYTLPKYFDGDTPPALCYIDHMDSWASNENCILYNAPLVAMAFYFRSL